MRVNDVILRLYKVPPPIGLMLYIDVVGLVTTSGWVNGRLEPRFYIKFPEDGIQDFDFVADPPAGIALMVVSPIAAKRLEWPKPPLDILKGVRIHAQSNNITKHIEEDFIKNPIELVL